MRINALSFVGVSPQPTTNRNFTARLQVAVIKDRGRAGDFTLQMTTRALYVVFLHAWARAPPDAARTIAIGREILDSFNATWWKQVTTVGAATWPYPTSHRAHVPVGFETPTLEALQTHCNANPRALVAYVHTKGAYHPSDANTQLRRELVDAAARCTVNMSAECDVCGNKLEFIPLSQFLGNMWVARCEYIRTLVPPATWKQAHTARYRRGDMRFSWAKQWCTSADRYADETWVLSRPGARACPVNGLWHRPPHQTCTPDDVARARSTARQLYALIDAGGSA